MNSQFLPSVKLSPLFSPPPERTSWAGSPALPDLPSAQDPHTSLTLSAILIRLTHLLDYLKASYRAANFSSFGSLYRQFQMEVKLLKNLLDGDSPHFSSPDDKLAVGSLLEAVITRHNELLSEFENHHQELAELLQELTQGRQVLAAYRPAVLPVVGMDCRG